jgi:hypothetical protein
MFGHLRRPAHTHGSAHRADRAAQTLPAGTTTAESRGLSGDTCPKARCGRWTLSWSAYPASTDTSCQRPKISIWSSPLGERCPPEPAEVVSELHEEIPGLLGHPLPHRMRCHAMHVDPACRHLDHQQHLQPLQQHRLHSEEVHGQHTLSLRPAGTAARRELTAPVPEQHRRGAGWPTRCCPDPVPVSEAAQLAVDATVIPCWVLPGQLQHQRRVSLATAGRSR